MIFYFYAFEYAVSSGENNAHYNLQTISTLFSC